VNYTDSIVYNVEIKQKTNGTEYSGYVVRELIKQNNIFNTLPNLPIISNNNANKYSMSIGANITKQDPDAYHEIIKSNDSCWHVLLVDGATNNSYIKSLGGPYFSYTGFYMDSHDRTLVYYKKGSTTWGVPLVISGVNQPKAESNITVLPNPTIDKISINNLTETCTFELLDLKGSVMLRTTVSTSENTINVSQYDKGLYLYRISANGALLKAGKRVKN